MFKRLVRLHSRLRFTQQGVQTSPQPHRAWMHATSLISNIVQKAPEFAFEWRYMTRTVDMKEGGALAQIRRLTPVLEAETSTKAM